MTLPAHWRETMPRSNRVGTWRFEIRSAKRFRPSTLRTVRLDKVRGVKMIAGKLRDTDSEFRDHAFNAMVPQAILFDKGEWPDFRDALAWQQSHFTRLENPPRRRAAAGLGLHVIQFPSGRWGFVGSVPQSLAYEGDADEIEKARRLGPGFAKVKTRSWESKEAALQAAREAGARVENPPRRRRANPYEIKPYRGWKIAAERFQQPDGSQLWSIEATKRGDRVGATLLADSSLFPDQAQLRSVATATIKAHEARAGNPPKSRPRRGLLTVPEQHQLRIAKQTLRMSDAGARIMGGMTKDEARSIIRRFLGAAAVDFFDAPEEERRDNPHRGTVAGKVGLWVHAIRGQCDLYLEALKRQHDQVQAGKKPSIKLTIQLESYQERIWRLADMMGQEGVPVEAIPAALTEPLERRGNPPGRSAPRRLVAFQNSAKDALSRVVDTASELDGLFMQAMDFARRGEPVPSWIADRARGLQDERRGQVDELRLRLGRLLAAEGEFSVPPDRPPRSGRRDNPARARAEAVRLYEKFHGRKPTSFHLERVPDLSQLVSLGRVLSIDYQLEPENARGARNTPYTHKFGPGSSLLTDPTGRVLVVFGNLQVSRAKGGHYGYIREAAGG